MSPLSHSKKLSSLRLVFVTYFRIMIILLPLQIRTFFHKDILRFHIPIKILTNLWVSVGVGENVVFGSIPRFLPLNLREWRRPYNV